MHDVLLVSLGGTAGLREADAELAASLRRAGATVEVAAARPVREWRTMAAIELAWARSARRAAAEAGAARAVLYSSSTAALLAPRPGAIRFDAPAAGNRPGRHGLWQRPVERRRLRDASLLVPWSEGGLAEAPAPHAEAVVVPVPVEPSGAAAERDIAAITYGAHPEKKGLDRVLAAWAAARREGEELVVAGLDEARGRRVRGRGGGRAGGRSAGRALRRRAAARGVPRARAPRARVRHRAAAGGLRDRAARGAGRRLHARHDRGPRAVRRAAARARARPAARRSRTWRARCAPRSTSPAPGYAERAAEALRPWAPAEVDRVVADVLLPRLLDSAR